MLTRVTELALSVNSFTANGISTNGVNTDKVNTKRVNANRVSALISTKAFKSSLSASTCCHKASETPGKNGAMPQWVTGPSQKRRRTSAGLVLLLSFGWIVNVPLLASCSNTFYSRFHRWNGWFARRAENHSRKMVDWGRDRGSVRAPVRSASAYIAAQNTSRLLISVRLNQSGFQNSWQPPFIFILPCDQETSFNFY